MAFIVMYERGDGSYAVEPCADLDLAISVAERLRNVERIDRPRIYATHEVDYEFRPYFRVEVAGAAVEPAAHLSGATTGAEADDAFSFNNSVDEPSVDGVAIDGVGAVEPDVVVGDTEAVVHTDVDSEPVEWPEFETPEVGLDDGATELVEVQTPDVAVQTPDVEVQAPDIDLTTPDVDLTDAATQGADSIASGKQKQGLFDKFVKTLEGNEGAASGVVDAVDDLGDQGGSGLFGR